MGDIFSVVFGGLAFLLISISYIGPVIANSLSIVLNESFKDITNKPENIILIRLIYAIICQFEISDKEFEVLLKIWEDKYNKLLNEFIITSDLEKEFNQLKTIDKIDFEKNSQTQKNYLF